MPDVSNDQLSNLFFKQYNQVYDTQKSLETVCGFIVQHKSKKKQASLEQYKRHCNINLALDSMPLLNPLVQ